MKAARLLWPVGRLPFIWKALDRPSNGGLLPDALPFSLGVDEQTGTLVQLPDPDVEEALSKAYAQGSEITGTMESDGIGKRYAEDFLAFILAAGGGRPVEGMRILEIGCGTGYLLNRLKAMGADVIGIEPGDHGQAGAKKYGVPIVQDFFPSARVSGKFDLVLMFAVLEHMSRPVEFLVKVREALKPSGRLMLAVPDCEAYISAGDISMLLHEHWNYFEEPTLRRSLELAGWSGIEVEKSKFGGSIYAACQAEAARPLDAAGAGASESIGRLTDFKDRAEAATRKLGARIAQAHGQRESVGIFVPSRAVNALSVSGAPLSHCRFFDDNPVLHGTYFPGMDIAVESREQLLASPPRHVLIMSRSFGTQLAAELRQRTPPQTAISTWSDFFALP